MILFSHPTGNQNVRHAALALEEAGLLAEFCTCVSWDGASPLNWMLPRGMREQLCRRTFPDELKSKTRQAPLREIGRLVSAKFGFKKLLRHETGVFSIDAIYRAFDDMVARRIAAAGDLSAVYAYEDGAASSFAAAKKRGLFRIYDLPIGYWKAARAILDEELTREPEWSSTLTGTLDSAQKLARKDEELALAQTVIVASSFTKKTLEMATGLDKPVHIIPYGAPDVLDLSVERQASGPLKVLFVGGLGQRKGLSYLLNSMEMISQQATLTMIGMKTSETCKPLNDAVRKHRWIPSLTHDRLLEEMRWHDVLVFPSLFEGFGLVLLEAMSQGLPVIATAHTAAPDLIEDGREGFIVPVRSAEAIAEKLHLLARDPDLLFGMKQAALDTAKSRSWAAYRSVLAQAVALAIDRGAAPQ
jgi:starch synthase